MEVATAKAARRARDDQWPDNASTPVGGDDKVGLVVDGGVALLDNAWVGFLGENPEVDPRRRIGHQCHAADLDGRRNLSRQMSVPDDTHARSQPPLQHVVGRDRISVGEGGGGQIRLDLVSFGDTHPAQAIRHLRGIVDGAGEERDPQQTQGIDRLDVSTAGSVSAQLFARVVICHLVPGSQPVESGEPRGGEVRDAVDDGCIEGGPNLQRCWTAPEQRIVAAEFGAGHAGSSLSQRLGRPIVGESHGASSSPVPVDGPWLSTGNVR